MRTCLNFIDLFFGKQIRIKMNTEMPVQVDGEPWIQTPGEVVVSKSALKVCGAGHNYLTQ